MSGEGKPRELAPRRARRRLRPVLQSAATECGCACLTMVADLHGLELSLGEVRALVGIGRDGNSALGLLEAARRLGMRGRAVSVELDGLSLLPRGAVLHWQFRHYVVLERVRRGGAVVVDPAAGRRFVSEKELHDSFTGVALIFEPGEGFEPASRRRSAWWPLRPLLRHAGLLAAVALGSLLLQLLALGVPLLTGAVLDRVLPMGDADLLALLAAGAAALIGFTAVGSVVRGLLLVRLRAVLDAALSTRFVEHLAELPYAFFQLRRAGDLLARLNVNTLVREILTSSALSVLLDGGTALLYLGLLLWAQPKLGLVVLSLAALHVALFLLVRPRQRQLTTELLQRQATLQSYQVELLGGIETLKALGEEPRATSRWANLFAGSLNVVVRQGRLDAWFGSGMAALQLASPLAVLLVGAREVLAGQLTVGTMMASSALAVGFLQPVARLLQVGLQTTSLGAHLERIADVLAEAPEQPAPRPPAGPLRGEIALEGVSFRYGPELPPAVVDVTARVRPGTKVAIVGLSGSGKSTVAKLLLGLYAPGSGRVLFDGRELGELDARSVRQQLGVVTQDVQLFSGSIRENIALSAPEAPLEVIVQAAQLAHVHADIAAMPMGYETVLADRGLSLSGGQRQRLALARALLRRPAVLLLDEATSSLDALTEALIHAELARLRCTRVVISHRLSTIADSELILVMDRGRVAEAGSHRELLERGGLYVRLMRGQLEAAEPSAAEGAPERSAR